MLFEDDDWFDGDTDANSGFVVLVVLFIVVFSFFDGVISFDGSELVRKTETVFVLWRSELMGDQRDDTSEDVDFAGSESSDSGFESLFATGRAFPVSEVGSAVVPAVVL